MFGVKLRELRSAAGLSQAALADLAGVSQRAVAHWEQGLRQPTWDAVQALAKALGVDCRAFVTDDAATPPKPAPRGRPPKAAAPKPARKARKGRG